MSWKHNLHAGDEVVIDGGDNHLPPSVIIAQIEYLPDDAVRIVTTEGETIQCLLKEIS